MSARIAFLDSAYLIALAVEPDELHAAARRLARRAQTEAWSFVTTWAVMLEVGNALSKPQYRRMGVSMLEGFFEDPKVAVIPLSESLLNRAIALFAERTDKSWSLTDCASFLVMKDAGIHDALTSDEHFDQAGFRALLRRK
jgi:predicted nucleic acid-binding protein